ncbi:hypothetical protein F5X99DRAFT_431296 [Biscogniauxia marginata]|nr:hypothetical protein F5X99DRAFT_431296 [Biscogniauxia marginata]
MKLLYILLLNTLPLALSFPGLSPRSRVITDPDERERLHGLHEYSLEVARNDDVIYVDGSENGYSADSQYGKRQIQILGLAGLAIVQTAEAAGQIGSGVLRKLATLLGGDVDTIWDKKEYCRTQYQTKGGGNCKIKSFKRGSNDAVGDHKWDGCGWNNPEKTTPPIEYFESDDGLGKYSVQFTATDEVAWKGAKDTKKCPIEGLCHPQYVFYRDGYNIVLNTWKSQGSISACQYSDGKDCRGLCDDGVKNQFTKGGNVWGGSCAIPCKDDTKLPDS